MHIAITANEVRDQVTELYTSHSPDYLNQAVKAIDDFFGELTCELRVNNLIEILNDEQNI